MPATPDRVVLHPLVLLSVVDHYNRVARDTRKRVVGVLLGDVHKGVVDVSNSFAGGHSPKAGSGASRQSRWTHRQQESAESMLKDPTHEGCLCTRSALRGGRS
jgi:hypothetical protein